MPATMVCPVSSSVRTVKVGSSSARRWSATESFSWSAFVFGSMACLMTGSGKIISSNTICSGSSAETSVSPVPVSESPMAATSSPA
jgi:hypothetical protein